MRDPDLPNLLVDADFASELNRRQSSWRRIVSLCVACGITCPALSSSLMYFDAYRRERLPANLTQVLPHRERLMYYYAVLCCTPYCYHKLTCGETDIVFDFERAFNL